MSLTEQLGMPNLVILHARIKPTALLKNQPEISEAIYEVINPSGILDEIPKEPLLWQMRTTPVSAVLFYDCAMEHRDWEITPEHVLSHLVLHDREHISEIKYYRIHPNTTQGNDVRGYTTLISLYVEDNNAPTSI